MEFEEFERRLAEARALVARRREDAIEMLAKNVDLSRNAEVFEPRHAGETNENRHNSANWNPN